MSVRRWCALTLPSMLLLCLVGLPGRATAEPSTATSSRYTMTAFTNSSESAMYVYDSPDATTFTSLKGPAYSPPTGLIRDPSVFKHTDGFYYLVYTTGWDGNTIGFARSPNRVDWTFLYDYTIPLDKIQHTWAPEWFVDSDGTVDVIVSLSTGGDFTPHLLTPIDSTLTTWRPPVALSGLGPNYIDTFLVQIGSEYHAFTKNEKTKFVEHAVASSPAGPYELIATGDWAGWGTLREGESLVQLDDGSWRIFLDAYSDNKYLYSDSRDGFRTWTPPQQLPSISGTVRHFTVLKETVDPAKAAAGPGQEPVGPKEPVGQP